MVKKATYFLISVAVVLAPVLIVFRGVLFNSGPIIHFCNPSNISASLIEGESLLFSVGASDPNGDVLVYTWKIDNVIVGSGMNWTYHPGLGDRGQHTVLCEVSDGRGGFASRRWTVVVHFVSLTVTTFEADSQWVRDPTLDRPLCEIVINYSILNDGDVCANNVELLIQYLESENVLFQSVVDKVPSGEYVRGSTPHIPLSEGHFDVLVSVSAGLSFDNYSFPLTVSFPRYFSEGLNRFYVTPNDPIVKIYLKNIGSDINSIYSWVGDNVHYEYDQDVHNQGDYWQFPYETLNLRTGDCEDQAFLLCSLLRASGISVNDVFLGVGEVFDPISLTWAGHAWVIVEEPLIGWRILEPTLEGIISRIFKDIEELMKKFLHLTDRKYSCVFNDLYFEEINKETNSPYINHSFEGWYQESTALLGNRVTVNVNSVIRLKIKVTNPGHYSFIGIIKIEIKKDIVWEHDILFVMDSYVIELEPGESQILDTTLVPDEITTNFPGKCRQYFYKIYTCFVCIYDPTDPNTRSCLFVV